MSAAGQTLKQALDQCAREYLTAQIQKHGGNVSAAAKASGLNRTHFYRALAKYRVPFDVRTQSRLTAEQQLMQRFTSRRAA